MISSHKVAFSSTLAGISFGVGWSGVKFARPDAAGLGPANYVGQQNIFEKLFPFIWMIPVSFLDAIAFLIPQHSLQFPQIVGYYKLKCIKIKWKVYTKK